MKGFRMTPPRNGIAVAAMLATSLLSSTSASGGSSIYYRYDSNGRLDRVCNALPGDGERTTYGLDPADNRYSYWNLKTDGILVPNSGWSSPNGSFTLWFQPDGNLVLYRNSDGHSLWATNTVGSGANYAVMQSDGNLVLYSPSGGVWHSATYNYPCATIELSTDGNVAIVSMDRQVVWQTGTGGQ